MPSILTWSNLHRLYLQVMSHSQVLTGVGRGALAHNSVILISKYDPIFCWMFPSQKLSLWSTLKAGFSSFPNFLKVSFYLKIYYFFLIFGCMGFLFQCEEAPEVSGSVLVVHGLSCSMAWGILAPWPGIEPMSPALQGRFLITGPALKSLPQF